MIDFDYHFGIHSNVPECCARWYQEKINLGIKHIGASLRPDYIDNYWDVSYVPCDECDVKIRQGNYVANKIHYCDHKNPSKECKYFLKEIYDYR